MHTIHQGTHPTLSSQESSGRYFIYHNEKVRKLTLKECFGLMGFPDDFKLIGNSIVIPMIKEIAQQVKIQLLSEAFQKSYTPKPKQTSLFDLLNAS